MLIVDEVIEKSSGDKTEHIASKPVLFVLDEHGKRDYTLEKNQLSDLGEPYVGPLPKEKNALNMREIAGNKAFEYLQGKRYYDLTGKTEDIEENRNSNGFLNIGKWFLLAVVLSGITLVVLSQFFPAGR